MSRPAIFFDRDNTLIIGNDYLGDPAKVVLIPGAADAIARARSLGYATVVVSNQSGVARGMFGEDDVRAVNARMDEMLRAENPDAIIERHEFCPFHPQAPVEKYRIDSDKRKPRAGMLLSAAKEMDLDLSRSWMIGDAARDIEAGKTAGCRAILFTDPSLPTSPEARVAPRVPPDFVVPALSLAMERIGAIEEEKEPVNITAEPPVEASVPTALARVPSAAGESVTGTATTPPPEEQEPVAESTAVPPPEVPMGDPPPRPVASNRLEMLAEQILQEMRRRHEQPHTDFSVSKLLAGIVQMIAVAMAFWGYLNRDNSSVMTILLSAIFLQAMTSSLLIMSRQK